MNRRTFLTTLLAVVTLPKAVMSKAGWSLAPETAALHQASFLPEDLGPEIYFGKRWDMRTEEVIINPYEGGTWRYDHYTPPARAKVNTHQ